MKPDINKAKAKAAAKAKAEELRKTTEASTTETSTTETTATTTTVVDPVKGLTFGGKVKVQPALDCLVVDEQRVKYEVGKEKEVVITMRVLNQIKSGDLIVTQDNGE